MTSDPTAIEVRDVRYGYPDGTGDALAGVSVDIGRGDVHALMGANGAGKTTLLKLLAGLREPSEGSIRVPDEEAVVGYAPENPRAGFFAETVADEVAFFPENRGLDVDRRVEAALDAMDVSHLAARTPLSLSGGEQRRVSIASVLAGDPAVVALDEPTSGLHAAAERELGELLAGLDRTVVFSTHESDFAFEYADRVTVLVDGGVLRTGGSREVLTDRELLCDAGIRVPGLVEWAARRSLDRVPSSMADATRMVTDR
jgi:energy-coupling factor transporter ATP-binding protein EcfA2